MTTCLTTCLGFQHDLDLVATWVWLLGSEALILRPKVFTFRSLVKVLMSLSCKTSLLSRHRTYRNEKQNSERRTDFPGGEKWAEIVEDVTSMKILIKSLI